jgi:hypothetical protein
MDRTGDLTTPFDDGSTLKAHPSNSRAVAVRDVPEEELGSSGAVGMKSAVSVTLLLLQPFAVFRSEG